MEMGAHSIVPTAEDLESNTAAPGEKNVTTAALTAQDLTTMISNHPVVMFSKSTCPFCIELKRTLQVDGIPYAVFEVDQCQDSVTITEKLKELSGISTYPNLFVNGKSIGGGTECKELDMKGTFQAAFDLIDRINPAREVRLTRTQLFWFPETINKPATQVSGILAFIVCLLCTIFYEQRATKWVVLALALDFFLRLIAGGAWAPIGMVSSILVSYMDPVFMCGAPKQFAAFCGFFMATLSAGLLLGGQRLGGTIVIALLMGPTGLEGFLGFCLGCWMFGYGITFKLIPQSVYRPYLNLFPYKKWRHAFRHDKRSYPVAENAHILAAGQTVERATDLIAKDRIDTEYKFQDHHFIKHVKVAVFGWPMALAALSFLFKLTDGHYYNESGTELGNWGTLVASDAIGIISAVLFCAFALLYIARTFMYRNKVIKEWNHPISGNLFSAINICLALYGILMYDHDLNFGIALVWIASGFQMFIAVEKIAALVFNPFSDDLLNPSIMMSPVANFVCVLGLASYQTETHARKYEGDINYLNIARLWFAVAALYAIVLFTITFNKALRDHHADTRLRPTIFIWMATAAIAGPAYFSVSYDSGLVYQCLWALALFFFAVNVMGHLKGFFTYVNDMSIFMYAFSYSALALSTFHYYIVVGHDQVTRICAIISVVIACASVGMCTLHAISITLDGDMFRPKPKWGPISFLKLTHEAFRLGMPKMVLWLDSLGPNTAPMGLDIFIAEFEAMVTTYLEHGIQEETVIFPAVCRYFPGFPAGAHKEHEEQHRTVERLTDAIAKWRESKNAVASATMLNVLKTEFPDFATSVLEHLRHEEACISVVARKYFPIALQKELTNRVFQVTSTENWDVIMPYVIKNLGNPTWQSQFLMSFIWANPDRAQEIGLMLYRTLDSATYVSLTEEIPEMVPRGDYGHRRAY
jgi:tellurite resistance protein TehA-like permease/glutaredoxin